MSVHVATVLGPPVPYGDKRAFVVGGKAVMIPANRERLATWRSELQTACLVDRPEQPVTDPVRVTVEIWFARPKTHFRTGRRSHELREDAPRWQQTKPDGDKVLRAVMDCLTGIWVQDDSRVPWKTIVKRYVCAEQPIPCTVVRMERLP